MIGTDSTDMTASGHKKFLFDTDFSLDAEAQAQLEAQLQAELEAELAEKSAAEDDEPVEDVPPTYSEEDLQRARDEGFQAGHTEATQNLTTALEQRLATTLDNINAQVAGLFDAFAQDKEEHSRDAVAVATVIVRKLFPALNMDKAMAEIEHMIVEAMQRTSGSPTLVVRVPSEMHQEVETKANELAALRGREGTITVMADDDLAEGDAAVEWDGGGMIRDSKLMWQEIDEIIERNLGTERANGHSFMDDVQSASQEAEEPLQEAVQEVVNEAPVEDNGEIVPESPEDLPDTSVEAQTVERSPVDAETETQETETHDETGEIEPTDSTPGDDTPDDTDNAG